MPEGWIAYLKMMKLIKCVYKIKYNEYKSIIKNIKRLKIYLYIYIINTGSNNKTIPKTICLAFRYNEGPVAP